MYLDPSIDIASLVESLPPDEVTAMLETMWAIEDEERYGKFAAMFPDEGPRRRELYPKQVEFFADGKTFRERCFMAANQVGKTTAGAYECACHLTGLYPDWWPGRVFKNPIRAWAAGDYNETTRDIVQKELLGDIAYEGQHKAVDGTGMIPKDLIGIGPGLLTWKQGVADLIDTVRIRHVTGGWSLLGLKSYMQGRKSFQGTKQHLIWFDEEPPEEVYNEALIRTATTGGIAMLTFTPLSGHSEVVEGFLPKPELGEGNPLANGT